MNLKISVIIPVYNGERFIKSAIESVLQQTYPVYEIIVINDGSTDGTARILEQFQEKIVWKVIPNGGVSRARNAGIELSTGEWVAFLDADDVWYLDKIEKQVSALEKYSDVHFCCGNFEFFDPESGLKVDLFSKYCKGGEGIEFNAPMKGALPVLIRYNFVGTPSVIVKKSLLKRVGQFNVNYRQSEDYDLWLRCALQASFLVFKEPLFFRNRYGKNLTDNWVETCQYHQRVLIKFLEENKNILEQEKLTMPIYFNLARNSYEIGNLFYEKGEIKRSFGFYVEGLRCSVTPRNCMLFLFIVFKKSIRTITGGILNRRNLKNIFNKSVGVARDK